MDPAAAHTYLAFLAPRRRCAFWPHPYTHDVTSTAALLYGTTQPEDGNR